MTESRPEPVLVLWDVDHTLVCIDGGVSHSVYERAFSEVTGRPLGELADMTGRTERAIIEDTLRLNGIERPDMLLDAFYRALGAAAEALADRMRTVGVVLPGAQEAIAALAGQHTVQSLVTGNIRPIATTKLRALGLADDLDFTVGGYGNDGSDRADLVRHARERATAKYGTPFAGKRTFVIGDTPHDIKGAHDAGAYAIGVATGRSTTDDLAQAGADTVLPDLTELAALRRTVLDR